MPNPSIEKLIKNIVDKACNIFEINYDEIAIMIRFNNKNFYTLINSQDPDLLTYTFKNSIYNVILKKIAGTVKKNASLKTTTEFVKLQGLLEQLKTNIENSAASKRVATKRKDPPTTSTSEITKRLTNEELHNLVKLNKDLSSPQKKSKTFAVAPINLQSGSIVAPNELILGSNNEKNEKTVPVFKSASTFHPMSISFLTQETAPQQEQEQKNISDFEEIAKENSVQNNYPTV